MSNGTPQIPGWYINFQAAVLKQLPRPGEINQNTSSGWENNQSSLKQALAEVLCPTVETVRTKILNFIRTIKTSATTKKFVAKKKFVKDSKEVKFYGFFGSFREDFLTGNGKIEDTINSQELRYGDLVKGSVDDPIIKELGGKAKAETTLTGDVRLAQKAVQ